MKNEGGKPPEWLSLEPEEEIKSPKVELKQNYILNIHKIFSNAIKLISLYLRKHACTI